MEAELWWTAPNKVPRPAAGFREARKQEPLATSISRVRDTTRWSPCTCCVHDVFQALLTLPENL